MRAAIYARYSTDMQSAASIEDQIRVCRERIEREGWTYNASYSDRAVSGASRLRLNYQALLEDARRGAFDIVVAEALDRLSRDQEDVAHLFKHLSFAGIKLFTLSEGEISEIHNQSLRRQQVVCLPGLANRATAPTSAQAQQTPASR